LEDLDAAMERNPTEKEIVALAVAEGHDADIPTNIGALPRRDTTPTQDRPSGRRRRRSMVDKDIENDIEKEKGIAISSSTSISSQTQTPADEEAALPQKELSDEANEEADPNIVFWDGPDDPQNPMNWSTTRKWLSIGLVSMITFLTPLGSSSFAPGVPALMDEFHNNSTLLSGFVVSVYVLGFAIGPLAIAPLSEMYGRLPLYHICGVLFAIFNIACAVAGSLTQLIVFRLLAGCFGAAPLALGGGTIADLARPETRATAMAIWTVGPTIGPVIGPVAGGFICMHLGWRWNFYIIAIAAGVVITFGIFTMKETYAPALLEKKARRLRKETGNPNLRSKLDKGMTTKQLFLYSIVRPSKMLIFSPVCLSQSLYVAIVYSYLYLMFTTVTEIFEKQYHFRTDLVGLAYIGMGLGSFIGQFGYTYFENRNYRYHQQKGDLKPEHRLLAMVPGSIILPIALFWYAWSVEEKVHWMCPIIAMAFFGLGLLLIFVSLHPSASCQLELMSCA
jgi:multidrug resistance protein